jgi:hypothetical protein
MLHGIKPQYTGATDVRRPEKESFGEYLKQTFGMLKINHQIIQALRGNDPEFARNSYDLLVDYEFLIAKAATQIKQNTSSIPAITAMIAVEESRKAIQQANDIKWRNVRKHLTPRILTRHRALTTLATVYIPLSFVAGVFDMNVTQFNPQINVPIWIYFIVALPITAVSML